MKDRSWRLHHIGDARIEIADAIAGASNELPARPVGRTASWLGWLLAIVLALALVANMTRRSSSPDLLRLDVSTPPTADPTSFAISPDGKWVAFVGRENVRNVLWVRPLNGSTARPLPGTDDAAYPFWSPDSRTIAFRATGFLKRIDVNGGHPQILTAATGSRGGDWNSQGVILFQRSGTSALYRLRQPAASLKRLRP